MSIVVATWNVQWQFGEWERRQPAILETLRAVDADLVTLQECWRGQVDHLVAELGYADATWAGYQHEDSDRSMGNAILSRWPIGRRENRFLEDREGRRYRTIVFAAIDSPQGELPLFTTHLEYRFDRSSTRVAQLQAASEFVEEHGAGDDTLPPILTGDLNAVPDSDEIRRLTGRSAPYVDGRIWTDAWEQVGAGPGLTWSLANEYLRDSTWPNRRLDYVLVGWPRPDKPVGNPKRAWLIGTEPVDGVTASDHYGIACEIHT